MKYEVFSENEWVYPDSPITVQNKAELFAPRGADVCFQVLTDYALKGGETITAVFSMEGCEAVVYQLLTATVPLNSDAKMLCTTDYDSVKHFVTRKAPFDVYEITRPIDEGETEAGRAAFYIRINVAADAPSFLHWGYHAYNPEGRYDTNYHTEGVSYPAGNGHVVYPMGDTVWYGVRGHLQRAGAVDYELFHILGKRDKAKALALIGKVCRTFDDYEFSHKALDSVRRELLEASC